MGGFLDAGSIPATSTIVSFRITAEAFTIVSYIVWIDRKSFTKKGRGKSWLKIHLEDENAPNT